MKQKQAEKYILNPKKMTQYLETTNALSSSPHHK